jgi:hypothetical protein
MALTPLVEISRSVTATNPNHCRFKSIFTTYEGVFVEGVPQGVEEVLLGVDVVVSGEGEDSKGISTSCNISCFLQSFCLDYHIVLQL